VPCSTPNGHTASDLYEKRNVGITPAPKRPSGWHHHGDYDTYIYVLAGSLHFEFGPEGTQVVEAGPGDFVHVPRQVVHRESNRSADEGVAVAVRTGGGPPVVNVDGPQ
jgi:uncharacterized RmlC-like cupin family protein